MSNDSGSSCPYRHFDDAKNSMIICHKWSSNCCYDILCKDQHPATDVLPGPVIHHESISRPITIDTFMTSSKTFQNDHKICKFFSQGKCRKGNECPFIHQSSTTSIPIHPSSDQYETIDKNILTSNIIHNESIIPLQKEFYTDYSTILSNIHNSTPLNPNSSSDSSSRQKDSKRKATDLLSKYSLKKHISATQHKKNQNTDSTTMESKDSEEINISESKPNLLSSCNSNTNHSETKLLQNGDVLNF
eukprot:gene8713-18007_t